ncbi:DEAD/DEAH box helicase [Ottowia pentelensis]|uniref:DEAD/DEAH box helicase n=1 Tax=Ottowia pentelensis TaxID=511108 RepID=A0ABV6PW45_9BURK
MLPSLLANDIHAALKQFLVSAFEPADAFHHGLMRRFVDDEAAWLKGPYVQVGLPFEAGQSGRAFFEAFETTYPGFRHQEQAWERLLSQRQGLSTLVATGTGSGKTECFLYPVLDHCARARTAGEAGVKALVIYPMNALATDQARRMAALIAQTPAFAGLRVGLYVGGATGKPGEGMYMTPTGVITDRDTLRRQPPDILLTNYKMLDYLMLRPKDRKLWASNTPTTLRYVVVDELHTFDGAQGTDLALLLRRLRARLKVDASHLICAGTSATLGGTSDTAPLREYARQVFGVPFAPESVVTESRLSVDSFLDNATVDHMFIWQPGLDEVLDAAGHDSPQAAVRAWFGVFFPGLPQPAVDTHVNDTAWRMALGSQLKSHQLFVNLLRIMKGGVVGYQALEDAFARNMPAATRAQVARVLDALLVLVAWALREGNQPLVMLRVQLWARELRRMVARLSTDPAEVRLRSERDLPGERDGVYLPLVQCSQCRTTGWLSRLVPGSNKLSTKLDEIYNTWFSRRPEATRLYAAQSVTKAHVEGVSQLACVACGNIQQGGESCLACAHQELLPVFRVTAQRTSVTGNAQYTRHDDTCPSCGERGQLLLLGARNATLGSQVVEASWASIFNDDKKLIAFSDSVQDAAHRAGFFGARTWLNNVRTAWAHVLDELGVSRMSWAAFLKQAEQRFDAPGSVLNLPPATLVAEFIAPNMTWQRHWSVELQQKGHLPADSRLPQRVKKRVLWQLFADLTYLSQRGRTLERVGKLTLSVPWTRLEPVAVGLLPALHEHFGLRGLDIRVLTQWLWGMLTHMRRRGGVMHAEFGTYAADGDVWHLAKGGGRAEWMPAMGDYSPHPVLLTLGTRRGFDKLGAGHRKNWYDRWADATLGQQVLLPTGATPELYRAAFDALLAAGILLKTPHHQGDTLAINPDTLQVDTDVIFMTTRGSKRRLVVPRQDAEQLLGMPCLDAVESLYEQLIPDAADWWRSRFSRGDLRRVIAAEHTGLLARPEREALEERFKSKRPEPWYENLLSATPTLEMGVDIGDLSSVLLCSVPPSQASFLQRMGRAGRRDGNAMTTTLADGNSPHDLYFFAETEEMMAGEVAPPGVFLQAAEVLRRQLFAFCMDDWVSSLGSDSALPDKTSSALDAVEQARLDRFPHVFSEHVLTHEQRLFDSFVDMLGADMDETVRQRLLDFMQGQGEADGLRTRLTKALEELVEERRTYKKRKDELDAARGRLQQQPQDEATQEEISKLQRERGKMLELIAEINGRDLLNTLTDAGLIPNYAFPEAGIQLKSVLWRKRASDDVPGQGDYVTLATQKYERPAHSALSEFAPENRFYANQRRVEVDQINMNLAQTEEWRFCPSCHHMQNLAKAPDVHATCPRCGDGMWADAGQRQTLLRFRQAIANSNDTEVRIDDSSEDREPKYYVRQLMADFDPSNIREAWQLPLGGAAFGFEFISRVTFRDVNFGELAKTGEVFKVADKEAQRPGFRLCRHCGMVQKPPRRNAEAGEQTHSFDCSKRGSSDPGNLLQCLYLYREFESEALRILVPYTKNGVDERVVQSFMAAVQLGLKRRFGGKVDHLRMVLQDQPGKDGGPRKHYVMLYDSVPGGTGYLHQLLAHDAGTLGDVLTMALAALNACPCNEDPEKDGCYRCLYQYRLGRSMELVSRNTARDVLSDLVGSLGSIERVPTISDIYINPNFDSVLERRFIESLKKLGGAAGLPPIKLVQDIVHGKSGFMLQVGDQRYRVQSQVSLGDEHQVQVWSKPDFVIWPWAATSRRRPVAVFCDGWAYHKSTIREDALKRSAILAAGRFWVWSITHQDVSAALDGKLDTDLESPLVALSRHGGDRASPGVPRAQEKAFTQHAIARLLHWLSISPDDGDADPAVVAMQGNAAWATFLMVPSSENDKRAAVAQHAAWLPRVPFYIREPGPGFAHVMSRQDAPVSVAGWWPMMLAKGLPAAAGWSAPSAVVLDDGDQPEAVLHSAWRQWLHFFNTAQFLPGALMASAAGLDAHDYDALGQIGHDPATSGMPAHETALGGAWQQVLEHCLGGMSDGLQQLASAGALPPAVGMELADDRGQVVADAELCWGAEKLALLRADQADLTTVWLAAGWSVETLDESLASIGGQPWQKRIAERLGLSLKQNKEG